MTIQMTVDPLLCLNEHMVETYQHVLVEQATSQNKRGQEYYGRGRLLSPGPGLVYYAFCLSADGQALILRLESTERAVRKFVDACRAEFGSESGDVSDKIPPKLFLFGK